MQNAFVERRFNLEPNLEVVATIFAPEERDGSFRCDWTITWPDRSKRFYGVGEDGVQALIIAMIMIETELTVSPEYKSGKLTWLGMQYLGLPSFETFKTAK
jgi:hypothetical protein